MWIHRARQGCRFPCRITLVAATNPCPCGWYGDPQQPCRCGEGSRRRYWGRLSGPLLDRIDLQVVVRRPEAAELAETWRPRPAPRASSIESAIEQSGPETSRQVAARVRQAHRRMRARNPAGLSNAELPMASLASVLGLEAAALDLWERAVAAGVLTARGGQKVLRVARTISDLAGHATVGTEAVGEALTYRWFDRSLEPERPGELP